MITENKGKSQSIFRILFSNTTDASFTRCRFMVLLVFLHLTPTIPCLVPLYMTTINLTAQEWGDYVKQTVPSYWKFVAQHACGGFMLSNPWSIVFLTLAATDLLLYFIIIVGGTVGIIYRYKKKFDVDIQNRKIIQMQRELTTALLFQVKKGCY